MMNVIKFFNSILAIRLELKVLVVIKISYSFFSDFISFIKGIILLNSPILAA